MGLFSALWSALNACGYFWLYCYSVSLSIIFSRQQIWEEKSILDLEVNLFDFGLKGMKCEDPFSYSQPSRWWLGLHRWKIFVGASGLELLTSEDAEVRWSFWHHCLPQRDSLPNNLFRNDPTSKLGEGRVRLLVLSFLTKLHLHIFCIPSRSGLRTESSWYKDSVVSELTQDRV